MTLTYRDKARLPDIAEEVIKRMGGYPQDESDLPWEKSGLCKIVDISTTTKNVTHYDLGEEPSPAKRASDIRQAPVFFFGGLFHDYIRVLGNVIDPFVRSNVIASNRLDSFHQSLVFCPKAPRDNRIRTAYRWNADKLFPFKHPQTIARGQKIDPATINDLRDFTDELWQHRFCDDKGRLLPSKEFNGFAFVTYSIGGRFAYLAENLLREKLRGALRETAQTTGSMSHTEENTAIQNYFNKCKIISIGHGLDWREAPEDIPTIPKLFLIGRDDKGVVYHQKFYDFMRAQNFGNPKKLDENSGIMRDISSQFHAPPGTYRVLILKNKILDRVSTSSSTVNLHGLPDYMRALNTYRKNPDVKSFIDELNNVLQIGQERSQLPNRPDRGEEGGKILGFGGL
jgi:hypothetical protein